MPAEVGAFDDQQRIILELINGLGQFFQTDPQAQAQQQFFSDPGGAFQGLLGQEQARASGADQAISPGVLAALLGQSADGIGASVAGQQDIARRSFSRSGLRGSGLEASALGNIQRQASTAQRAGRRDITTRAELANDQARTAARQRVAGLLQQQFAAQQQMIQQNFGAQQGAADRETAFRSQFQQPEDTNQAGQVNQRFLQAQANAPFRSTFTNPAHFVPGGTGSAGFGLQQQSFAQQGASRDFARERLNQLLGGF